MDIKEAVRRAKGYVSELLAEEGIVNLGLEEIEHDDEAAVWNITVGFSRPWNACRDPALIAVGDLTLERSYRVVQVRDRDGEVISLKRRDGLD